MKKIIFLLLAGVILCSTGLSAKSSEKQRSETLYRTGQYQNIVCTELKDVVVYDFTITNSELATANATVVKDSKAFIQTAEFLKPFNLLVSWTWEPVSWRIRNMYGKDQINFKALTNPPNNVLKNLTYTNFASTKASRCS
jgi:hypothetical protein